MKANVTTDPAMPALERLTDLVRRHERLFVLTGAGCSTASGIPDYRDLEGDWKRASPMTLQAFMGKDLARARYWARSMIGWRTMARARPNSAHETLAELERRGHVELLVTQNVDRLHQHGGSDKMIDLHGRIDRVRCMDCELRIPRSEMQARLESDNPDWLQLTAERAPDGDADLDGEDFAAFKVPPCPNCGGVLKPDVVFFGEGVPRECVMQAGAALERADAMLIVGSSLMVYSGYRFASMAHKLGKPIAAINRGRNRADPIIDVKVEADCGQTLQRLLGALAAGTR